MRFNTTLILIAALLVVVLALSGLPIFGLSQTNAGEFTPVDTSRVLGSPDPLPPLSIERAFPDLRFEKPLQVTHAPDGTDRIFVCTQGGRIYVLPNRRDVKPDDRKVFLDLSRIVSQAGGEEGLMSIAFHPQYRQNGIFFVYFTIRPLASRVVRYRVDRDDRDRADPATATEILAFDQPYPNHKGGSMEFGPDGYLYIGLGDGGAAADPHRNGQNLRTLLGKILRLDVDHESSGRHYAIPDDNPFAHQGDGVRGEIWCYGVRNIWRLSFDRLTGTLWAGDVGQDLWEEIDVIVRGGNYGWNLREGKHPFRPQFAHGDEKLIDPLWEYLHTEGKCIIGGLVYRGKKLPELFGAYLYADYVVGRIWALRYDGQKVTSNLEITTPTKLPITSFGEDRDGEVLFTAFDGYLYRFRKERSTAGKQSPAFPRKLSETGLFTSTAALRPAAGMIPYDVNVPLWSDNAVKQRYLALPREHAVGFDPSGNWSFPLGTVLVKTFYLDTTQPAPESRQRLETRLLVNGNQGWVGYTYLWNDEQSDAQLLDTALERTYEIRKGDRRELQKWHFPSRAECITCHTQANGFVLGLNTRQLNRSWIGSHEGENQLLALERQGVFVEKLPQQPQRLEAFPAWNDSAAEPSKLARACLDVNCAICHRPGGGATTEIDLRYHTSLDDTRLLAVAPRKHIGDTDSKLLSPRHPEQSELLLRMKTRGEGQMPPLATTLIDTEAAKVVRRWIEGLPAGDRGAN